jgi:hypothetical protein
MQKFSLLIGATALALVSPALAQGTSNTQTPTTSQTQQQPGQANQQAQAQQATPKIAQQIRKNLEQAGFKNIKLMPSSFMVRAEDPSGNPVMMVINPDSITEVSSVGNTAQSAGSSGAAQSNAGQSNTVGQSPSSSSSQGNASNNSH